MSTTVTTSTSARTATLPTGAKEGLTYLAGFKKDQCPVTEETRKIWNTYRRTYCCIPQPTCMWALPASLAGLSFLTDCCPLPPCVTQPLSCCLNASSAIAGSACPARTAAINDVTQDATMAATKSYRDMTTALIDQYWDEMVQSASKESKMPDVAESPTMASPTVELANKLIKNEEDIVATWEKSFKGSRATMDTLFLAANFIHSGAAKSWMLTATAGSPPELSGNVARLQEFLNAKVPSRSSRCSPEERISKMEAENSILRTELATLQALVRAHLPPPVKDKAHSS